MPESIYLVYRDQALESFVGQRIVYSDGTIADVLPVGVSSTMLPQTEFFAVLITGVADSVAFTNRAEAVSFVDTNSSFRAYAFSANGQLTPITDARDPVSAEPSDPQFDLSDVKMGVPEGSAITSALQLDGRTVAVAGDFDAQSVNALADRLGIEFGVIRPVEDFAPGFDTPSSTSIPIGELPQALLDEDIATVFVLRSSMTEGQIARVFARHEAANGSDTLHFSTADEILPMLDDGSSQDDGRITLSGTLLGAEGVPLEGVTLTFSATAGQPEQTVSSDAEGAFVVSLEEGAAGRLEAARAYDRATDPAITASDALEVLRMAVGLEPSFGPASPQNYIAADINQDGQVTAEDALDVLRAAVGLQSANEPRWVFLDADVDLEGIDRRNTEIEHGIVFDPLEAGPAEVSMTGVLLGSMQEYA